MWNEEDHPALELLRDVCVNPLGSKGGLSVSFPKETEQYAPCNATGRWQNGIHWTANCGRLRVAQRKHPEGANETWITERTLYPTSGQPNIVHFLMDELWTLYPESKFSFPPWPQVWIPSLDDDEHGD